MPPFEWKDMTVVNYGDLANCVREIVRLYKEYDVNLATEFIDDYGTYLEHLSPDIDGRHSAMSSIGYMAGYEDQETKHLIFELFETEHPLMGKSDPTPEEAFELGKQWGEAMKEGRPFP